MNGFERNTPNSENFGLMETLIKDSLFSLLESKGLGVTETLHNDVIWEFRVGRLDKADDTFSQTTIDNLSMSNLVNELILSLEEEDVERDWKAIVQFTDLEQATIVIDRSNYSKPIA